MNWPTENVSKLFPVSRFEKMETKPDFFDISLCQRAPVTIIFNRAMGYTNIRKIAIVDKCGDVFFSGKLSIARQAGGWWRRRRTLIYLGQGSCSQCFNPGKTPGILLPGRFLL